MFKIGHSYMRQGLNLLLNISCCFLLATILYNRISFQQHDISLPLETHPFTLDLYHRFNSNQEFKLRGSILVKPKTEYRIAQAYIINQVQLSDSDLSALKEASEQGDTYYLKVLLRKKRGADNKVVVPEKITQTLVKTCSLYTSNLADFITINLSPLNVFINVNLFTIDPECIGQVPEKLSKEFNTTIQVESGAIGPTPDTATYIKRLEEERKSKLKEGKEENQSFFAKYWIYIVPAVIILMVFSGPSDQGGR